MAFTTGSSNGPSAEINVTPLIDVLLVLLIIFMVIVPIMPRGMAALVPQPPKSNIQAVPEEPIVVQVAPGLGGQLAYRLNQQPVTKANLGTELGRVLAGRQEKVLFVRGDARLQFSEVAEVIGFAREASADRIGILTPGADAR